MMALQQTKYEGNIRIFNITQTTIDAFRRQWMNTQKILERWKHYTWLLFQIEEEGKKKNCNWFLSTI